MMINKLIWGSRDKSKCVQIDVLSWHSYTRTHLQSQICTMKGWLSFRSIAFVPGLYPLIVANVCTYIILYIWRFPEIGIPPNHPFIDGFSKKTKPSICRWYPPFFLQLSPGIKAFKSALICWYLGMAMSRFEFLFLTWQQLRIFHPSWIQTHPKTIFVVVYLLWYVLLTALASFCVGGHSYPGSICRMLGTIYRILETIYRIPEAIYCIILILAFFVSKLLGLFKKKHSEAKAVTKPSVYNNRTLMGFGPVF